MTTFSPARTLSAPPINAFARAVVAAPSEAIGMRWASSNLDFTAPPNGSGPAEPLDELIGRFRPGGERPRDPDEVRSAVDGFGREPGYGRGRRERLRPAGVRRGPMSHFGDPASPGEIVEVPKERGRRAQVPPPAQQGPDLLRAVSVPPTAVGEDAVRVQERPAERERLEEGATPRHDPDTGAVEPAGPGPGRHRAGRLPRDRGILGERERSGRSDQDATDPGPPEPFVQRLDEPVRRRWARIPDPLRREIRSGSPARSNGPDRPDLDGLGELPGER